METLIVRPRKQGHTAQVLFKPAGRNEVQGHFIYLVSQDGAEVRFAGADDHDAITDVASLVAQSGDLIDWDHSMDELRSLRALELTQFDRETQRIMARVF